MAVSTSSTGIAMYFWKPGKSAGRKLLPINVTGVTHNGVTVTSRETTHLLSPPPDAATEFGGRTYEPGVLGDPGELTLACLFDPNTILPKGKVILQLMWPRMVGFAKGGRWLGMGFCTNFGGFAASDVDTNVTTNITIKLSGRFTITRATNSGGAGTGA